MSAHEDAPIMWPAQMRSKEETGEILANRFVAPRSNISHESNESLNSTNLVASMESNPMERRRNHKISYEDMLKRQVKQFTMKDQSIGNDQKYDGISNYAFDQTIRRSDQSESEFISNGVDQTVQLPAQSVNNTEENIVTLCPQANSDPRYSQSTSSFEIRLSNDNLSCKTDEGSLGVVGNPKPIVTRQKPPVPPRKPTVAPKNVAPKKSVRFSDNVSLVACTDDVPRPIDYVAYAVSYLQRQNKGQTIKCPTAASTPDLDQCPKSSNISSALRTKSNVDDVNVVGSTSSLSEDDSDFCDNTSDVSDGDSEGTMIEGGSGRVRCSLCHKKWVDLSVVFCSDCNFYMSKFEQVTL